MSDEPEFFPIHAAFGVPLNHVEMGWVGMLSIIWAQLEFLVELWIYHLRNQTFDEGRATSLPRDISKRIGVLYALAGDTLKRDQRVIVLALCERGMAAAPKRNLAIHGNWMVNEDIGAVSAVSWFKVPVGETLSYLPHSDVPGLVIETASIGLALYQLLEKRGGVPHGPIHNL